MVDVPTVEETQEGLMESGKPALAGALGRVFGQNLFGNIGGIVGAVAGAYAVDSSESGTVSTIAMYDGITKFVANPQDLGMGGSSGGEL